MKININGKQRTALYIGDGIAIVKATGQIWSTRTNKIIADEPRSKVSWYGVQVLASHLVASAYLPEPTHPNMELHHINGNPADNRPSNLVWLTKEQHKQAHAKMHVWMQSYLAKHAELAKTFYE